MTHTRTIRLATTAALALAALFLLAGGASAAVELPHGLRVTGTVEYRDTALVLTGELRVADGGTLTLDGVELTVAPDADGVARIVIEPGGSLLVEDSLITAASADPADAISVAIHGEAKVAGTTLRGLAPSPGAALAEVLPNGFVVPPSGLLITGRPVVFEHVEVLSAAGCGASLVDTTAAFDDVSFRDVRPAPMASGAFAAGVCVEGGSPTLAGLDLRGAFAFPPSAASPRMAVGVAVHGAEGLTLRSIDARGILASGSATPGWSAAVLLVSSTGVTIDGGRIADGQNGVVSIDVQGPQALRITGLSIVQMVSFPVDVSGTFTVATDYAFDNGSWTTCGANGVRFVSDGSTARVTLSLDNVTVSNCSGAGFYVYVHATSSGSIHDITIKSCTATNNGQQGFYIRGENIQAAVSPVVSWSTASHNGYSGFYVWNNYPSGSTAIAVARFDYNTAINNSEVATGNDGGFWLDLGSPNTLALRYNNNTAIGNKPASPGSGNYWGHRIQVAVRSSMVIPPDGWMSGNVALENERYGIILLGGASASGRFDNAKLRDTTIQDHQVGLHAENARVEVWTSHMSNTLELEGILTDFVLAGTVHNRLSGTTTGVKTIQSYKAVDITALWQNDLPVANTTIRFINGSGSSAAVYSSLTPVTLASNLITDAQGHWSGWVLDWIFDPNLPASQANRLDFAPLTVAVQPQADESRSDPFDLVDNVVGPVTFNDEIPPVIIVQSPRDNGVYTTSNLNVTGVVTDSISGVARLQISLDGENWTEVNRSGGSFNYQLIGLPEGTFDLSLRAWDRANDGLVSPNISLVVLYAIRIDTQPPALQLVLPALVDGDIYYTNQPVMVFQGLVDASVDTLFVNGQTVEPQGSYFLVQRNLTSEGPQTFVFLAVDTAGNTRQITVTVVRDTFDPTLIITSPSATGAVYVNTNVVIVRGITDDNTNITVAGTNYTVTNQTFVIQVTLTEGENDIHIRAEDAAGNTYDRTLVVFSDTRSPEVRVTSLSNGDRLNSTRVVVTGTVDEPVSYVLIDEYVVPVVSGSFSATIGISEGANSIVVRAIDLAGNVGTTSVDVEVDTVPPAITLLGLPDGLTVSDARFVARGSLSEAATLTLDGVDVDIVGLDFDAQVDLVEGLNNLTFVAVDSAGNRVEETRLVTLDTEAPPITITRPKDGVVVPDLLVLIEGTTEPFAVITVGGHQVPADEDGAFSAYVELPSTGSNLVVLEVRDQAGNDASKSVTIDYQPGTVDDLGPLMVSGGIAAALAVGLAVAGLFLARRSVAKKVAEHKAPQPAEPEAPPRAPRPPRAPGGAPPRPPRPPSN